MSVSEGDGGIGGAIKAGVLGFCFEGGVNLITGYVEVASSMTV